MCSDLQSAVAYCFTGSRRIELLAAAPCVRGTRPVSRDCMISIKEKEE